MEAVIANLTTAQVSLALSVIAAYGLILLYVYQVGFFKVVGFEFAGMTSSLDLWSNAGTVLLFLAGGAFSCFAIAFVFQALSQFGFHPAQFFVEHDTAIFVTVFVITTIPTVILSALRWRSNFDQYAASLNIILIFAFCYSKLITGQPLPLWQLLSFIFYLPVIAGMLGANHGISARLIDTRRYDIYASGEILRSVRLIRASSSGILYAGAGNYTCFINPSKVERIDKVA